MKISVRLNGIQEDVLTPRLMRLGFVIPVLQMPIITVGFPQEFLGVELNRSDDLILERDGISVTVGLYGESTHLIFGEAEEITKLLAELGVPMSRFIDYLTDNNFFR